MPMFSVFCHLCCHLISCHIVFHRVSPSQLWSASKNFTFHLLSSVISFSWPHLYPAFRMSLLSKIIRQLSRIVFSFVYLTFGHVQFTFSSMVLTFTLIVRRLNLQACFLYRWHAAFEHSQDLRLMHRMAILNHERMLLREYFLMWQTRYRVVLDETAKWVCGAWTFAVYKISEYIMVLFLISSEFL